jgi:lipopolysaccharide export system ATP-binding protein
VTSDVSGTGPAPTLCAHELRWRRAGRWIVDGVDLAIRPGEIVGLLGPNGAGKTVTLSMMAGLLEPTSGRVTIGDIDVTGLPLYRRARLGLGYLPQERSIFTKLSARENILAILQTTGIGRREASRRADELLARFGLSHLAKARAAVLSGGEQRRLEVARSLGTNPRFLLFDEPFAGIDPLTIESLHDVLVDLRASDVGILITDHNVRETLRITDRAYIMYEGRILLQGTASELANDAKAREIYLGERFSL